MVYAHKHAAYDLVQMQSMPLAAKVLMTQQRVLQWYEYWGGQVYVSFSGGKDSTVLKHIVDSMYNDVPSLFINTGLEFPEIQQFAMTQKNVVTVRPDARFDEVLRVCGYPIVSKDVAQLVRESRIGIARGDGSYENRIKKLNGEYLDKNGELSQFNKPKWKFLVDAPFRISEQCCNVMKKKPAKQYEKSTGRKPIIGTMATESASRRQRWLKYGCNAFDSDRPASNPMSFWTEQDVLHYIKQYDVPYSSVYGEIVADMSAKNAKCCNGQISVMDYLGDYRPEDLLKTTGYRRTGCIFCAFGSHCEKEPTRFQRLRETHPKQYKYCIGGGEMVDGMWQPSKEGLGLGKVLDYIGVKY